MSWFSRTRVKEAFKIMLEMAFWNAIVYTFLRNLGWTFHLNHHVKALTPVLLKPDMPCIFKHCRSALSWSVNFNQQPRSSNLIGWKIKSRCGIIFWSCKKADVFCCCDWCFNLYHSLGKFSRRQIHDSFFIFPREQDLIFHANCLQWRQFAWNVKTCFLSYFSQKTGFDILCKLSPMETICMKCQNPFSGKDQKNISICYLLKILPRVLSVNG